MKLPSLDDPRALLRHLYDVAVQRALPLHNTAAHLPRPPKGRTLVLGAGKAGGAMAHAVEALWPRDAPLSGLVVTRYGHTPPRPSGVHERIEVVEAAHPVPDAAGLAAAQRILALTQGLTEDDLVLCLISGGGSSLLTLPCEGLTLEDKQRINRQLLESGAHIGEMNTVRKHLSRIKGGRLAAACAPARVVTRSSPERRRAPAHEVEGADRVNRLASSQSTSLCLHRKPTFIIVPTSTACAPSRSSPSWCTTRLPKRSDPASWASTSSSSFPAT